RECDPSLVACAASHWVRRFGLLPGQRAKALLGRSATMPAAIASLNYCAPLCYSEPSDSGCIQRNSASHRKLTATRPASFRRPCEQADAAPPICDHDFPECIPGLPGAAAHHKIHLALVRRFGRGVGHSTGVLSVVAARGISIRSLAHDDV